VLPQLETPNELQILLLLTPRKVVSLKESLGKVTIVDFWASWCAPCRRKPNVVAIYKDLHSKGLNIVGVSLDKDAAKWKEAIAKIN
jgi:thiol-disulfide isomerase/thioredoxin